MLLRGTTGLLILIYFSLCSSLAEASWAMDLDDMMLPPREDPLAEWWSPVLSSLVIYGDFLFCGALALWRSDVTP